MEDHRFTDTILRATNVQSAIQRFEKRAPAPLPPFRNADSAEPVLPQPRNLNSYDAPLFVNTNIMYPVEESSYFPQITPPREHVTYGIANESLLDLPMDNMTLNRFESGFKPSNFGKTIQGIYNSTEAPLPSAEMMSPSSYSVNLNVLSPEELPPKPVERKHVEKTVFDNSVSHSAFPN